jgi:phosphoglycerate dehydrogenase-like enzyme
MSREKDPASYTEGHRESSDSVSDGSRQLEIWCNLELPEPARAALVEGTRGPGQRLVWAAAMSPTNSATGAADAALAAAGGGGARVVAFGQPEADQCAGHPRLGWIHLSSAGYTPFDRADVRDALGGRGAQLTTSSGVFAEPCAQHALALMLAEARRLPPAIVAQARDQAWRKGELRRSSVLLLDQRVLLVGFGAIGRRLVQLLAPFGLDVHAVRRQPAGDEPVPVHDVARLEALLADADHVLDLLPGNAGTERFFGAARFAAMKRGAVFYNIGRGTTVDQAALREALLGGRLRAAYLDVTDPEPLPPEHPLWSTPGCVITPHTAGGHADEPQRLVAHFLDNLARYRRGEPLRDRVV